MSIQGGTAARGPLAALERFTHVVNRIFVVVAALTVLVIMLLVVTAVFFRYALNAPINGALDLSTFLLVFVFFLALAPALESGSHIEVDLFDPLVPAPWRKAQRLIGKALTVLFAAVLLTFICHHYIDIVDLDELSFTMLTVQLKYIYWIGPVGAAEFLLTAIASLWRFASMTPQEIARQSVATGH